MAHEEMGMSLYRSRMVYLLNRDFYGTVKQWRENPAQLDRDIRNVIDRATEYAHELKMRGIDTRFVAEYVQNMVAPVDLPNVTIPDETLYAQVMKWAVEQEYRLLEEHWR